VDSQIRITQAAIADFEAILEYSWVNFPDTAKRFGNSILSHVEMPRQFPCLGALVPGRYSVRVVVHYPIRIYYRVHLDLKVIEILHFWHGSRSEPLL
jgi:plasmid stabilization system protein ParE